MMHDAAIIGGGVMGCTVALTLAEAGMQVAVVEQFGLGSGASGVNAGTLSLQIKRTSLMPYAMRGAELWAKMSETLGSDIHHHRSGGLNLAFTDDEVEKLKTVMTERREAGLPIEFIGVNEARAREPELTDRIRLASFSPLDGYASANLTGRAFRKALVQRGVLIEEFAPVQDIRRSGEGYEIALANRTLKARRVVLAGGSWNDGLLAMLGLEAPIVQRINQMGVTERTRRLLSSVVGHISGLMSLKQAENGTLLIGGGWQGEWNDDAPGRTVPANLESNLRFAETALPALANLRLVRVWYGYDSFVPDVMPLVGALPGWPDVWMIGCVRGGYTIGPCMGRLLAQQILGAEPELPIGHFDPARYIKPVDEEAGRNVH